MDVALSILDNLKTNAEVNYHRASSVVVHCNPHAQVGHNEG